MSLDFASPAARKQSDDRAVRIEPVSRGELIATHRCSHHVHKRMPDKIHRHARLAVNFFFKWKNYDHALDKPLDERARVGSGACFACDRELTSPLTKGLSQSAAASPIS